MAEDWKIGDRVHIDGDKSLTATVTALMYRTGGLVMCEVAWISNGDSKAPNIEPWRLTRAEK